MTVLDTIAFDIETTGFGADDLLTVAGFDSAVGSRVFLNTGGTASPPELESHFDGVASASVTLSAHETERELLEAVAAFADSTMSKRDVKLVAFNGETWNGGFDLPFLRTRLSHHEVDWPFADLPYIDVMAVFEARFNTRGNTLVGVYDELVGDGLSALDPFDDSAEAVEAWETGDFERLLLHNVADVRRTRALADLAERYCSKSDFSMKSLDPVVSE